MNEAEHGAAIVGVLYQRLAPGTSIGQVRAQAAATLSRVAGAHDGPAAADQAFSGYFDDCFQLATSFDCVPPGPGRRNPYHFDTFEWLGLQVQTLELGTGPGLRLVRHHVLLSSARNKVLVLETHFAFDRSFRLGRPEQQTEQAISDAIYQLYWRQRKTGTGTSPRGVNDIRDVFERFVDRSLPRATTRRLQLHVLCDASQAGLFERSSDLIARYPIALYSLLHLHAHGINRELAERNLRDSAWRTTDFYLTFCTSEALLTLCRPYPPLPEGAASPTVLATAQDLAAAWRAWELRRAALPFGHEAYDVLPEFPALRYNSHIVSLTLLNAAYANARAQRKLRRLVDSNILSRLLLEVFWITSLERMLYRETSLDHVRLSVVREFLDTQLATVHFSAVEKTTTALRQNTTSRLLGLLSVISFLFLVIPALVELAQFVFRALR